MTPRREWTTVVILVGVACWAAWDRPLDPRDEDSPLLNRLVVIGTYLVVGYLGYRLGQQRHDGGEK